MIRRLVPTVGHRDLALVAALLAAGSVVGEALPAGAVHGGSATLEGGLARGSRLRGV